MKTKLGCVLILSFFISNYCYSNEIKNYNCRIKIFSRDELKQSGHMCIGWDVHLIRQRSE